MHFIVNTCSLQSLFRPYNSEWRGSQRGHLSKAHISLYSSDQLKNLPKVFTLMDYFSMHYALYSLIAKIARKETVGFVEGQGSCFIVVMGKNYSKPKTLVLMYCICSSSVRFRVASIVPRCRWRCRSPRAARWQSPRSDLERIFESSHPRRRQWMKSQDPWYRNDRHGRHDANRCPSLKWLIQYYNNVLDWFILDVTSQFQISEWLLL